MKRITVLISLGVMAGLAGICGWMFAVLDREEPVIDTSGVLLVQYQGDTSNDQLLEGVTAADDRDGDVSDTLVVESVTVSKDGNKAVVTYVAMDNSSNVAKETVEFPCEEGVKTAVQDVVVSQTDPSQEEMAGATSTEGALAEASGESMQETGVESASNVTPTEGAETESSEEELQQQNEAAALEQESRIAELSEENPRLYLEQHQLVLSVGEDFEPLAMVQDVTDDADSDDELYGDIQMEGSVDTTTPESYEMTYYAYDSEGNRSNEEVLTVTVVGNEESEEG